MLCVSPTLETHIPSAMCSPTRETHAGYLLLFSYSYLESKGGAVVRALASHQCGPGSNPSVDAICGLSLLFVLFLDPRGFSPGTPVFPSP